MIVLHISDLHCELSALRSLMASGVAKSADVIAFTGDAECDGEIAELLASGGKKAFFVPGNMDDVAVSKAFEALGMNLDGRVEVYGGYAFAGVGGISFMSSIASLRERLRSLAPGVPVILLSHHPPKNGVTDRARIGVSAGLVELREFVLERKPVLHLHGHIHEAPGYTYLGETLVVNPGPLKRGNYALIDVEKRAVSIRSLYYHST